MSFIDLLISGILALIMISIGLSLSPRSFVVTFARPRAYFTGLALQLLYLPAIAFLVMSVAGLPPAYKMGFIILAATPGGMTSSFISYLLGANTALSICLLVTNSLVALLSIPFIVNLGLTVFMGTHTDLHLPLGPTIGQIFAITIVPVLIGLGIRRVKPRFAMRAQGYLRWITIVLLAVLFLIKFFATESLGGSGITWQEIGWIIPFSLVVNILALVSGWIVGGYQRLPVEDQVTLGVEIGIQNTSLSFLIAGTLLGNEDMLKPALVYAMFTFFSGLAYGLILKPHEALRLRDKFLLWWKGKFQKSEMRF